MNRNFGGHCNISYLVRTNSLPGEPMPKIHEKGLRELILETVTTIPDQYLSQLLIDTYGRYDYHVSIARKNHIFFRNSHYTLSFLIPIYSAFYTYVVSNDLVPSRSILGALGLFLTILTIVIAILKPYERCVSAGEILIILGNWKTDLMVDLGKIQAESDETPKGALLYELLKKKDQEMSQIGEAMMANLIPRPSISVPESDSKKSK
jgi:hypothetical protein